MAQYTGTAGCGHSFEINLQGPVRERERRLAWMRSPSGMCNACYAQSKRIEESKQQDAEVAKLVEQIRKQYGGLPPADAIAQTRAQIASRPNDPRAKLLAAALEVLGV